MIQAIVFDMDGVLFDTERISCESWGRAAAEMNLGDVSEGITGCIGLNYNDTVLLMNRLYGENFPFEEFYEVVRKEFYREIEENGLPLMTGVREILDYLKEGGYKIGLASSTNKKSILSHLEKTGLTDYFTVVVSGDMVEHSKPEPDIYLKACEGLGVLPKAAMAIEDSPNGIRSAYRAGMIPVMVPDMVQPDEEITSLLYRKCDSLLAVIELIKSERLQG